MSILRALCLALCAFAFLIASPQYHDGTIDVGDVANAQIICCVPPPPPGGGGSTVVEADTVDHGGKSGVRGWKAGKFVGQGLAIGVATSSVALIGRGAYVAATEHREMMYGEAYCTAEFAGLGLVLKPLRILGDLLNGRPVPIEDVIFCPEDKLNKQYSPQLYAKLHPPKKLKRTRTAKHKATRRLVHRRSLAPS